MTAAAIRTTGGVPVFLADAGEPHPRSGQLAHPSLRLDEARLRPQRERVRVRQQRLHPLRGAERRQCLVESALREAQETPCVMPDQLAARLTVWTQGALGPPEPPLGLIEPSEPHQSNRSRGQGGEDDWILAPAVRVCDPHRLLAELQPLRQRQAGPRAGDPEVTETRNLEPGAPGSAGQLERLLEVPPGVIDSR